MTGSRRWIAALLLAAVPLNAQTRVKPVWTTPLLSGPLTAAAPAAALPAAPATLNAPIPALPAALPALPAAQAPAAPAATSAADASSRKTPETEAASAQSMFDGRAFLSNTGAVFVRTGKVRPGSGRPVLRRALGSPTARRPDQNTGGLSGRALLDRVAAIATRGQRPREYHEAMHYLFSTADHVIVNGVSGVVDAYSGVFIPGTSDNGASYGENTDGDGDGWVERDGMNVEHVWPQSFFNRAVPMRSDLHHLMATFNHPNGMRGTLPFGVVKGPADYQNGAGAKRGAGAFEPPDISKGRVARALLYFFVRYRNESFFNNKSAAFWNQQIQTALAWNRQFPPDVEEMRRNDLVEAFQNNRNPFIDDPQLADRIGADALKASSSSAFRVFEERRRGDRERFDRRRQRSRNGGRRR